MGFWVKLLSAEYERILWKPLRKAFPYIEKVNRQRIKISAPLNIIRDFRNRVFHIEPILWNIDKIQEMNDKIILVLGWINRDLPEFIGEMNSVPEVIERTKREL